MMIKDYSPTSGKIIAFDKPVDWTSFDVVNKIRRLSGIKKVGHAGTLDPFATGVLVLCLGPATKKSNELMNLSKEYIAEIALGSETDTMDVTGTLTTEAPLPVLSRDTIIAAFEEFVGEIQQEIPAYSAAKYKGQRLYKLAREGKEVPRIFKRVRVDDIELIDFDRETIKIHVVCGRGTYIRTLARDIARKLGSAGYVKTLVRTAVGDYRIDTALTIDAFQAQLAPDNNVASSGDKLSSPPLKRHENLNSR